MTGFITVSIKDNYLPLSPKPGRKEKLAMRAGEARGEARGAERAGGRAGRGAHVGGQGGETQRTVLDTYPEWDGHPLERGRPAPPAVGALAEDPMESKPYSVALWGNNTIIIADYSAFSVCLGGTWVSVISSVPQLELRSNPSP